MHSGKQKVQLEILIYTKYYSPDFRIWRIYIKGEKMLKINNLTIKYERTILENVNISFKRGAITVIKGASGSGKSSLLNILGLIQKPNKDCSYTFDNKNINFDNDSEKAEFRLRNIGFIFQQNNLLQKFTAIQNVSMPMRMLNNSEGFIEEKSSKLINYVGLDDVANDYPESLSGGEEQRVAIARALVNDADIILADEPTAALDRKNVDSILELLKKLAHKLNKIVIIVSHDETVAENGDVIYEISNKKIHRTNNKIDNTCGIEMQKKENNNEIKINKFGFLRFFKKNKKINKRQGKFLVFATAFVAAIATLFINFGEGFSKQQKDFLNSISQNTIFVINDTLGLNTETDYKDAFSFSFSEIEEMKKVPNIKKIYPFFEFSSQGLTKEFAKGKQALEQAKIIVKNNNKTIKEIKYDNMGEKGQFRIIPLYPEDNIEIVTDKKSKQMDLRDGVVITESLAKKLNNNIDDLIGKTIEISCFVPTKLYNSTASRPQDGSKEQDVKNEETIDIDGSIDKLVVISKKITGVLSNTYDNQRSEENENFILLNYNDMKKILDDNKNVDYKETFPGFKEKEWSPSSLVIDVTSFDNVPIVKTKIEKLSPTITVLSKATDIKAMENNLSMVKNIMQIITIILICIVMLMFGFIYYLKNKTRKKEIGILKALGLRKNDIIVMIGYETVIIAFKTFVLSVVIAFCLMSIGNFVGLKGLLMLTLNSVMFAFGLSFFMVIFSSIFSIWKTSRIDPIDAIRQNK